MTVLDEMRAIRERYGLTYERMAEESADIVGLTPAGLRHILLSGDTKLSTITAMEVWLNRIGRKRYPLGYGDWPKGKSN